MYHPINEPTCTPQLYRLLQIAVATVAFGLENDVTITRDFAEEIAEQKSLSERLGADFLFQHGGNRLLAATRKRFVETMEAKGFIGAGKWLWDKPIAIAEPVVRLVVIPLEEKSGVLDALTADIDLDSRFREGNFQYKTLSATKSQALELVKEIMLSFYSEILARSGVPAYIVGSSAPLGRQTVLRSYLDANKNLKVCPGCDGCPPSVTDGTIHEDCDHFFPKSRYPFLSIHPQNLTPYCKNCNQTFKRAKDALQSTGVTSLADIYHPYRCPACSEIDVVVERSQCDGLPHVHLRPKRRSSQAEARLNSLNAILDLEARWEGDLQEDRLSAKLEEALTYSTQDERAAGILLDHNGFKRKLGLITETMGRSAGQIVGVVPSLAYTRWVFGDDDSSSEWYERYGLWNLASTKLLDKTNAQSMTNAEAGVAILVFAD